MKIKQKLAISAIRLKFKILSLVSPKKTATKAFELFCTPLEKEEISKPSTFHAATGLAFTLNGKKVVGHKWGNNPNKRVLILHGFSSASYKFHKYVHPLLQNNFEVLAFDAPAHGNSEGKTVNAVEYCQMIEMVIKKYGPIQHFIAHSFGGIALSLAMERIEHTSATKIVFIAPATETTTAINMAFKMLQIKSNIIRKHFDEVIYQRSGKKTAWFSINRAIKNCKATILWIHDEGDRITPFEDTLPTRQANLPNVTFKITQGLGHKRIYHSKEIMQSIFEFLA
jgi:esterase/lipase